MIAHAQAFRSSLPQRKKIPSVDVKHGKPGIGQNTSCITGDPAGRGRFGLSPTMASIGGSARSTSSFDTAVRFT
jgi:hypothetical protein